MCSAPGSEMIGYFRFDRVHVFFLALFLSVISYVYGQTKKEIVVVLGKIKNNTAKKEYDDLNITFNRTIENYHLFQEAILDTTLLIDSVPDESSILRARNLNALLILWGSVDTSESGLSITLKLFDMSQASIDKIGMMIRGNEKNEDIADILCSKLLLMLRRTTMAHLIISTTPEAAIVILDKKKLGFTPFEGMVQPGTFSLELTKKSFSTIKIPVSFINGNTYQYDITLGKSDSAYTKDKRTVIRFLTVSLLCTGAGFGAHYFQECSMRKYRTALPPSDFNHLYRSAVCWNIARNTLWATAGLTICGMFIKIIQ